MRIRDWISDVCSSDLIGAHQRAAARIAEDDDLLDARFFLQPLHADADVEHRMFEQELVLDAALARLPAEETETLPREIGGRSEERRGGQEGVSTRRSRGSRYM